MFAQESKNVAFLQSTFWETYILKLHLIIVMTYVMPLYMVTIWNEILYSKFNGSLVTVTFLKKLVAI